MGRGPERLRRSPASHLMALPLPRPDARPAAEPRPGFRIEAPELCREVGSDLERELAELPAGESDLPGPFGDVLGPLSADLRALRTMSDELELISKRFDRAGLQNCGA